MKKNLLNNITILFFLLLMLSFLISSNLFDWDYFFTTIEIDLRSWFTDHKIPTWSYQFCAGSTRIGDPQSFALSPFFILTFFFGSFWGAKALALSAFIICFFYTKKCLSFFNQKIISPAVCSLAISCSNYFLWHFHHGHLTFISVALGVGIIYFLQKSIVSNLEKKDFFELILLTFSILSTGFYPGVIYLIIPVLFGCCLFLVLRMENLYKNRQFLKNASLLVLAAIVGIIIASLKFYHMIYYQNLFPRTVNTHELKSIWDLFHNLLVPTFNYKFLIGDNTGPWSIWEYSAFNIFLWLFPLVFFSKQFKVITKNNSTIILFYATLFLSSMVFYLGNFSDFSPHSIVNSKLFSNSIRVTGRYIFGASLSLSLLLYIFLPIKNNSNSRLSNVLNFIVLLFVTINIISFFPSPRYLAGNLEILAKIKETNTVVSDKLNIIKFAKERNNFSSSMYYEVLRGNIVPNCYQPLIRNMYFAGEETGVNFSKTAIIPILTSAKPLSRKCLSESFVTQNEIFIDQDCPQEHCLNLNALNLYDKEITNFYEITSGRICRKK